MAEAPTKKTTLEDALKAQVKIPKGFLPVRVAAFEVTGEQQVGDGTQVVGVRQGEVALLPEHRLVNLSPATAEVIAEPHLDCSLGEIRALSTPGGCAVI